MRWATLNGWWYGSEVTPVPRRMVCVRCAGGGQEHLGRGDHLPARRVVLAAPELVEPEPVEVFDEVEVLLELQRRMHPRPDGAGRGKYRTGAGGSP